MADGFKFASSACDPEMSSPSSSWPASDVRSTQMLRLPRLRLAKYESPTCREMSPSGGSILMTSAQDRPASSWRTALPTCDRSRGFGRRREGHGTSLCQSGHRRTWGTNLRVRSALSAPIITTRRISLLPSFREGAYVADEGIQWRTRRKHRCCTSIQQLLHVGLRDGAPTTTAMSPASAARSASTVRAVRATWAPTGSKARQA